jgi:hypothetical protein
VDRVADRLGVVRWLGVGLFVLLPALLLLGPWGTRLTTPTFRIVLSLGSGLAAGLLMQAGSGSRLGRIALGLLLVGAVFLLAKRALLVLDYPFKLSWSEGNRLWDYSLYFRRDQYDVLGEFRYPGYLTPGRHGLWGLPFLIPGVTISVLRLWDGILWTVPHFLLGWFLFNGRRAAWSRPPARTSGRWVRFGLALWTLVYLSQGPIYTPIILGAILVVVTYDRDRPVRSLVGAAVAGFYTSVSRWTWLASPGLWVALLAILDEPSKDGRPWWRQLGRPVGLAAAGLLGGLLGQVAVGATWLGSGGGESVAFKQPLLWYRLLPNQTHRLGIILGLIVVTGPLLGLLLGALKKGWLGWGRVQHVVVWRCLLAALAVGLVISVKMGGGSNLHNLDTFIVGLLLVGGVGLSKVGVRRGAKQVSATAAGMALGAAALVIPLAIVVSTGSYRRLPPAEVLGGR